MISCSSDRLERRMYVDVPATFDSQVDEMYKAVYSTVDAVIRIETSENLKLLADIPAERKVARSKAEVSLTDILIKRNVKMINLGNELYPTASRAKTYHISKDKLAQIFWAGVNTDYIKLQTTGQSLKDVLAPAKEVRITSPSGTDLTVMIAGRKPHVSDGVISDADMKEGFASIVTYLPAGEIFVTPVPGTAQGRVVLDRYFYEGMEIRHLVLDFKDGRLTSLTASSGLAPIKSFYNALGPGKDEFAVVDVGFNPNVKIPAGSLMDAWIVAGTVTVGIGGNRWAGGDNSSEFFLGFHLMNSTLKLDGRIIIENGKLKIEGK